MLKFRKIRKEEEITIREFVTHNLVRDPFDYDSLFVLEGNKKEVFLISKDLYSLFVVASESFPFPYYIGLYVGDIVDNGFIPSLPFIVKYWNLFKRKVYVRDKAAWLFTLGRDILPEGIMKIEGDKRGIAVVVCGNSPVGIGIWKGDVLCNLLDLGKYLRRQE